MKKVKCVRTNDGVCDFSDILIKNKVYVVEKEYRDHKEIRVITENGPSYFYSPGQPESLFVWASSRNPLAEKCYENAQY